ncbi:MAG: hypothetical protein FWD47_05355 [Treponema sp.]|nr:hypothetical protein [Treponema sp.]
MKIILIVIITLFVISCIPKDNHPNDCENKKNIPEYIQDYKVYLEELANNQNISSYYFPKNTFHNNDSIDAFTQNWYGEHLDILDNEIIYLLNNINIIRFTCLRTFHKPFSIKIVWNNNAKLYFNMSNGAGGYNAGELIMHFEKILNNSQINIVLDILNKYDFFNQMTNEELDFIGLDGSKWIIEANINNKYKIIHRWTPESGIAYDIGKYLIELSGERIVNLY